MFLIISEIYLFLFRTHVKVSLNHLNQAMHILVSVVIIVSVMAYFFYASYSIRACIYMRVFCCKKTEEKIIAITFDDGPECAPRRP